MPDYVYISAEYEDDFLEIKVFDNSEAANTAGGDVRRCPVLSTPPPAPRPVYWRRIDIFANGTIYDSGIETPWSCQGESQMRVSEWQYEGWKFLGTSHSPAYLERRACAFLRAHGIPE